MKTITMIEDHKLIHKQVSDKEYTEIMNKRDPDGMYWFHQMCKLP